MAGPSLSGRTVIVTGAASGIGAATIQALAEEGATTIGIDRAAMEGPASLSIEMSVTDEAAWSDTVARVLERFGTIDGLVNCAGIIRMAPVTDMSLDLFRQSMQVNVEGPFLAMKHVLPVMYGRGSGSVVNLSSTAGIAGSPGAAAYCASKAAVRLLSKSVALEALANGSGVRVNSLHPAMTETPMVQDIVAQLGGSADTLDQMRALQPSGRFVPVSAVVDAILFLLSDGSTFINGTDFLVDNGFTAQ